MIPLQLALALDPELPKQIVQSRRVPPVPLDGDGILKMLVRMAATPKDVIARYNEISGEKK